MTNYKYMNQSGIKVMKLKAIILLLIIAIVLLVFTLLNLFKFHWLNNRILLITFLIIFAFIGVLFVFVIPIYRYRNFRYSIENDVVRVRRGILFIKTMIVPYFRIQNIEISEGFIMRKYQLATLTLSTAGGRSFIELIDKREAKQLKLLIKHYKKRTEDNDAYKS